MIAFFKGFYTVRYFIMIFLLALTSARAEEVGMTTADHRYNLEEGPTIIVPNMPRLRFQRAIGLCTAFTAATLIDHANCVTTKTAECANVPDDKKVSPLDISRFNKDPPGDGDGRSRKSYPELKEGGGSATVLNRAAIVVGASVQESCAPYEQFFAGVEDKGGMQRSIWLRFEPEYTKGKSEASCPSCLVAAAKRMKGQYGLAASEEQISTAFAKDSYGEFLDAILIPAECKKKKVMIYVEGNYKIGYFPETVEFAKAKDKQSLYLQTVGRAKELLARQIPFALDYCAETTSRSMEKCKAGHSVVVKGYKKLCQQDGGDCKELFQVQNSLGQRWQDSHDDGWVEAKPLLDRTFYERATLSWLEHNWNP